MKWCRQEPGKRSQLWRMSSAGMLLHEGSSAPQDPHKSMLSSPTSAKSSRSSAKYVLDINDIALQPSREVPLTLRKPDDRRKSTQIWQFRVRCSCSLLSYFYGIISHNQSSTMQTLFNWITCDFRFVFDCSKVLNSYILHCLLMCVWSLLYPLKLHLTTSELWFGQEQEGILP